jgi:Fur family transcriptional regulator, ferric uptake regulator
MDAKHLLNHHDLRITDSRVNILSAFLENNYALSEQNIERQLNGNCDRVTIYRTLKTFVDKGLLHKVMDENNGIKYALCTDTCGEEGHRHEHAHFKCQECGGTSCLENVPIQEIKLPDGFTKVESNLLILGICNKCHE